LKCNKSATFEITISASYDYNYKCLILDYERIQYRYSSCRSRDATPNAVMPQYVVCPFVRLSVGPSLCLRRCDASVLGPCRLIIQIQIQTFRYRDHIGWNTSQISSRLISLRFMPRLTPTWTIWCNCNANKIRVEYGWGHEHKTCNISDSETVKDKTIVTMTD